MTKYLRYIGISVLASGAILGIISGTLGGWGWTASNTKDALITFTLAPKRAADRAYGSWSARKAFDAANPKVFAGGFLGPLLGLSDYTAPTPFHACVVGYWRIQSNDPRGVVTIACGFSPEGKRVCERIDPYSITPPANLPEWADEITCVRDDGTKQKFAVLVDRVLDSKERAWMNHYNRTVITLLERERIEKQQVLRSDT